MKETVLITGAHGLMARHLAPRLRADYAVKLLSTHPDGPAMYHWDVETGQVDPEALQDVDYIVHLAGAKFYDGQPLTEERKAISRNSRVRAAYLLLEKLKENGQTLKSFISSSAAGYYDFNSGIELIDEKAPKGAQDNADLCEAWEAAADEFQKQQVAGRVVKFRNSAVLASDGGLFQQFISLFGVNPALLEQQRNESYLPWIHIDDMTALLAAAIRHSHYKGVYNNAADEPVTMAAFIDKVTRNLEKGLLPEGMSAYTGVQISSERLKAAGFSFKYDRLDTALKNLLPG
jgi:uncharacterized protein (TIGR01777 family)